MRFIALRIRLARRTLCVAALSIVVAVPVFAADTAAGLYLQTIEAYPAPRLQNVKGREYKFLIDPAKIPTRIDDAFEDLWSQISTAARRRRFEITPRSKRPLQIQTSVNEYFDTADNLLWAKGYIVRVTGRDRQHGSSAATGITVKRIGNDVTQTLATPLAVTGGAENVKTEAEDNVGFGPGGTLRGYIEKGSSFTAMLDPTDVLTLGNFGKFVPELLSLGLSADTILIASKVFSDRIRPGTLTLPRTGAATISLQAWRAAPGGTPFLYEVSFGYGDVDFYNVADTHATAERFMTDVMRDELGKLGGPATWKWGGSKVRQLMNRPLPDN